MSWDRDTNPHFWPREPPPGDQPGPSRQKPPRIRQRERPDHVQLPPPVEPLPSKPRPPKTARRTHNPEHVPLPPPAEPLVSRPRPQHPSFQTHQPELELTPPAYDPHIDHPTSQDHWPIHPHEPSEEHWPLHPHIQAGHEPPPPHPTSQEPWPLSPHIPAPQEAPPHRPKRQHHPQAGPEFVEPTRQEPWPLHPHIPAPQEGRPPPKAHPYVGPTTGGGLPHKKRQQPPHVGPATDRPPRRHPPAAQPDHVRPHREQNLIYPFPNRTNAFTWFVAVFCAILWVVIILGGILILIIYLAYRPRSPHFEISDASLNAAYLDMGYLLNADLTLLVNFTNMNQKMGVDFNFIVLKLRYENHLIANQYIEPFYEGKLEKKFARVEMVGSQIRLPVLVTQQLVRQIHGNRITFEIDGYFHARSRLGSIFRYSYWLYSHCTIVTTGPPSGVMVLGNCITKR